MDKVTLSGALSSCGENARECVVVGPRNYTNHKCCVLIGSDLTSSEDYQVIIGNTNVTLSRVMSDDDYKAFLTAFDPSCD